MRERGKTDNMIHFSLLMWKIRMTIFRDEKQKKQAAEKADVCFWIRCV